MTTVAYVINGSCVTVIDTSNHRIVATIPAENPTSLAVTPDGKLAYIVNTSCSNVLVIDTASHTIMSDTPIPVGPEPKQMIMAPDGARAYVVHGETASVIDTNPANATFNTVIETVPWTDIPAPPDPAVTPDGLRAFVANSDESTISIKDTATDEAVTTLSTPGFKPYRIALTVDGTCAYVSADPGSVLVIDTNPDSPTFHTVISTIEVGGSPCDLVVFEQPPPDPEESESESEPQSESESKPESGSESKSPSEANTGKPERKYNIQIPFKPTKTDTKTILEMLDQACSNPAVPPAGSDSKSRPVTPGADVEIQSSIAKRRSKNKFIITTTLSVKNNGPNSAYNVVVTSAIPSNTGFLSVSATQGKASYPAVGRSGAFTCRVGTMKAGARVKLVIRIQANLNVRVVRMMSKVSSTTPDPNPNNNSASTFETRLPKAAEPKSKSAGSSGQKSSSTGQKSKSAGRKNKSSEPKQKPSEQTYSPFDVVKENTVPAKVTPGIFSKFAVPRRVKPRRAKRVLPPPLKTPRLSNIRRMTQGKKIIGAGARRVVYDLGNGYVLKVAKSKDGIRSNKKEVSIYNSSPAPLRKYIANVKDYENGYNWVIMEKYNRSFPKSEQYRHKLDQIRSKFRETGILSYEVTDRQGRPNYQNLRLKNNGDIVVIDYGNFAYRA